MFMVMSEYYQRFAPWLVQPIDQTHRLYLETHLELLSNEYEQFLTLLISEYSDDPDEQQRLRIRQELLRDIRIRGISIPSIREAYVNKFGGLILDVPKQLAGIEQHCAATSYFGWTERMVAVGKTRLQHDIVYAQVQRETPPEMLAELHYHLGNLFVQTSPCASIKLRERVLSYYETALETYTIERYPLQYAKVLIAIGNVYMWCALEQKLGNLVYALPYYNTASHIYSDYAALPQTLAL